MDLVLALIVLVLAVLIVVLATGSLPLRPGRATTAQAVVLQGGGELRAVAALRRLETGDAVEHLGHRWTVCGRLDFEEVGVRWTEYVLDLEQRVWLTIEDGHVFEVSLWRGAPDDAVDQGRPGEDVVVMGGTTYRLQEHGNATYLASGHTDTDTEPTGTCLYSDYRSMDRQLLGFENYGVQWRTATGRLLAPESVVVHRASRTTAG